jgi:hypothetical protein
VSIQHVSATTSFLCERDLLPTFYYPASVVLESSKTGQPACDQHRSMVSTREVRLHVVRLWVILIVVVAVTVKLSMIKSQ